MQVGEVCITKGGVRECRYALELLESPFELPLNPTPVYDHSSVYLYRIKKKPITIRVTFYAEGPSYVEVYDADNDRFLLEEKTYIDSTTSFDIQWDGLGVFEVRVWRGSKVKRIVVEFELPEEDRVKPYPRRKDWLFVLAALGAAVFGIGVALWLSKRVGR